MRFKRLRTAPVALVAFFMLHLGCLTPTRAATMLEAGGWATDQVWTNEGSPYVVQDGYSVANLSIDPGVVVKIRGMLSVTGDFTAVGTAAEPIVITCLTDDTIGGDQDGIPTTPSTDTEAMLTVGGTSPKTTIEHLQLRWIGGVWISSRGPNSAYHPGEVYEASFRNVSITHCSAGMNVAGGRTMDGYFLPWSLTIDGLIVEGVRQNGVSSTIYGLSCLDLAGISLLNADIQHCQTGVHIASGDVTVRDSIIAHNDVGLQVVKQGVTLVNNSIRHNENWGVIGPDQTVRPGLTVTATGNWWGDSSGPRESTLNPEGLGNVVSATVFDPPLAQPPDFDDASPTITTTSLRDVYTGFHQSRKLEAQGAYVNYTWTWEPVPPFILPAGLELSQDGVISGTPTSPGTVTFKVTATDGSDRSGSRELTLSITQPDPNSPLRGWWKFDEGSGTLAADSSGNGNVGSLVNLDAGGVWVPGNQGTALDFPGALDVEVNVGNSPVLNPSDTMTIAAWIKPRTYSVGVATIVERRYGSSYLLYINGSGGNFIFEVSGVSVESDVGLITLNEWHHIAVVFDAGTVTFYSNGSPVGLLLLPDGVTIPTRINQDDFDVRIGNDSTLSSPFDGLIDDVRIYGTALTQEQVAFIMANPDQGLPPHSDKPTIKTSALPTGYVLSPYAHNLEGIGGSGPYSWLLAPTSYSLPAGMTLNENGLLAGTPELPASTTIVVQMIDSLGAITEAELSLLIKTTTSRLSLTGSVGPNPTSPGAPVTYVFTVRNVGTTELHNVRLSHTLPPLINEFPGNCPDGLCGPGTTLTWEVGALAVGRSQTLYHTVHIVDQQSLPTDIIPLTSFAVVTADDAPSVSTSLNTTIGDKHADNMSTIVGSVLDSTSTGPVSDVLITATRDIEALEAVALTSYDGEFILGPLPIGTYTLRAIRRDYQTAILNNIQVSEAQPYQVIIRQTPLPLHSTPETTDRFPSSTAVGTRRDTSTSRLLVLGEQGFHAATPLDVSRDRMTIVLTHGYKSSASDWPLQMAEYYRHIVQDSANIVAWDWSANANGFVFPSSLARAASFTSAESKALASSLAMLLGVNYSHSLHFVGHSLGTVVNAGAADYLHGDGPRDTVLPQFDVRRTHVTNLDNAEAETVWNVVGGVFVGSDALQLGLPTVKRFDGDYTLSAIPARAHWVDNYVSAVGLYDSRACNVWLWRGPKTPWYSHSYATEWYGETLSMFPSARVGSYWSVECGGMSTAPSTSTHWIQSRDLLHDEFVLEQLGAVETAAIAFGGQIVIFPSLKGYEALNDVGMAINSSIESGLDLYVEGVQVVGDVTYEVTESVVDAYKVASFVAGVGVKVVSFVAGSALDRIWHFRKSSAEAESAAPSKILRPLGDQSDAGSYMYLTIDLPDDAVGMSFLYHFDNVDTGDFVSCALNGVNVLTIESEYKPDGLWLGSGLIDVTPYAGSTVELMIGLTSGSYTSGSMYMRGLSIYTRPPPALRIERLDDQHLVTWTSLAGNYRLQSSETLGNSAAWSDYDREPVVVDLFNTVSTVPSEKSMFFRLIRRHN